MQIVYGYPKVTELDLSNNPIRKINQFAFRDTPHLESLQMSDIQLNNYRGDLNFLKKMNNLTDLKLNNCFV